MSYPSRRKVYLLLLFIIFSVLQIWILSSDHCSIRTTPPSPPPADSDAVRRSKLHRKFFNDRFPHLTTDKSFQEHKRVVPSCPDPLHN
ncbi:hypothetical protein L2E82_43157 [Cichorium intybus]|uniref:Uncharacterized protein n=1 Tax=Cichorium intybus TaxID=13427 RepID=A0ACB8ZN36_CICIN|nr:hypothetical protein L2E82_43157 [Cichorium intybus]